jgi:hypothetical protein
MKINFRNPSLFPLTRTDIEQGKVYSIRDVNYLFLGIAKSGGGISLVNLQTGNEVSSMGPFREEPTAEVVFK